MEWMSREKVETPKGWQRSGHVMRGDEGSERRVFRGDVINRFPWVWVVGLLGCTSLMGLHGCGSGGTPGCPTDCGALEEIGIHGYCVAKSVPIPGGYFIDATPVTRCQYEAWLSTNPSATEQPSFCVWRGDFKRSYEWPPRSKGNHPVVGVTWCDAYAYCKAAGKRLCGKIGGGENGYDDYADASKSQWYAACSSGGKHEFPYGDEFDENACHGEDAGSRTTSEVGSLSSCQSSVAGYEGVYDLSGNVSEWEDSCDGNGGETDRCRLRGGRFFDNGHFLRCRHDGGYYRDRPSASMGFRCCSDP